jgi:mono/diheme cytochrome c family protein
MRSYRLALAVAISCFVAALTADLKVGATYGPGATKMADLKVGATYGQATYEQATYEQAPTVAAAAAAAAPDTRAVLNKYCAACHNSRMKVGGLALDALDLARVGEHAEEWEKVVRKVRTGAMPPVGRPRPDKTAADGLAAWLEGELDRAALANPNPGRPSLHRLNRTEYTNAIRDILALEIDAAALLPADNAAYGFDNVADALSLSPALTERYLGAAAKISQMALARLKESPLPDTIFVPTDRDQGGRVNDDLPFGSRGGLSVRYYFPIDGEYTFQLRLKEDGAGGGIQGLTDEPHQLQTALDDEKVWETTVGGPVPGLETRRASDGTEAPAPADPNLRPVRRRPVPNMTFRVNVKAGTHLVEAYFVNKTTAFLEDLFDPSVRRDPYRAGNGEPVLSSLTITPPGAGAASESPSRAKIFVCRPEAAGLKARATTEAGVKAGATNDDSCAKQIISTLAKRAYRRPVTDDDLQVPLSLHRQHAEKGGFDAGIEMALRAILVSPRFIFRFEDQPIVDARGRALEGGTPYRISDLELASRLSFFLWSSIPDDELLNVAAKGTLHTPAVLNQQVRRMLADPRSSAIVSNFAGQWLHTRNVSMFQPSPELLFHFDDNLRDAFRRETEMFVESIIRENRGVLELLDADYTFLNERLARHYGIPGVYGERFRRVTLPADSVRRGLLGQGSILTDTSRANRTSPVIRGKWILENIFGAPPPPPPPDVPELKDERDPRKVLPMREQMTAHRANPVCASCHAQMDQLGFALENFDAIGEWRDEYGPGRPVDASAELPDGTKFNGPTELRKVLLKHSDEFLTTMTEKLLVYALGRGLEASDAPTVRQIKREAARTNYRFASLIEGIVTSTPFTMRMAQADTN